ncbi:Uncharacterized protein TCM_002711 [Theobroma cacao]|uniref:Uncharacterized protein n=1 Tax=Theobroma cacao TaxID=3641 RepID=A0A061DM69_THECC|nr:Uncharacterized protein TCM_002711 [Theobroma cacao]
MREGSTKELGNDKVPSCHRYKCEYRDFLFSDLVYFLGGASQSQEGKTLIQLSVLDKSDEDVEIKVKNKDSHDTSTISLHALAGTSNPRTMRIREKIHGHVATILIDSGSTHNFINDGFAAKIGLQPVRAGSFEVLIGSGERLRSQGRCQRVPLLLPRASLLIDVFLLPLKGCEVVLETQWLRTLGPITWDFSKLLMRFNLKCQEMTLQGATMFESKVIKNPQIQSLNRKIIWVSSSNYMSIRFRLLIKG